MVKEIVDMHHITYRNGVLGTPDFNLAAPEIFSLECDKANRFRDEGIVEHSLVICRYVNEHQNGKLNVYYKQDENPQFILSREPLEDWNIMGCAMFAMNFYE